MQSFYDLIESLSSLSDLSKKALSQQGFEGYSYIKNSLEDDSVFVAQTNTHLATAHIKMGAMAQEHLLLEKTKTISSLLKDFCVKSELDGEIKISLNSSKSSYHGNQSFSMTLPFRQFGFLDSKEMVELSYRGSQYSNQLRDDLIFLMAQKDIAQCGVHNGVYTIFYDYHNMKEQEPCLTISAGSSFQAMMMADIYFSRHIKAHAQPISMSHEGGDLDIFEAYMGGHVIREHRIKTWLDFYARKPKFSSCKKDIS